MANPDINLFFFYRRYLWDENNFADWQEGMVDTVRGQSEGTFGGAVLQGFELTPASMTISVAAGIAVGPTGNLLVNDDVVDVTLTAPAGTPSLSLIVARPLLTDNDYITRPTTPFESVPLKQQQGMEVVLIEGTPAATPSY